MSLHYEYLRSYAEALLAERDLEEIKDQLKPHTENYQSLRNAAGVDEDSVNQRWQQLNQDPKIREVLERNDADVYGSNIENFIGTLQLPVGVAGPLRVNGLFAKGDYVLPFATTEAALVASYHRGAVLISKAGGCTSMLLSEGVTRSPGFVFENILQMAEFSLWLLQQKDALIEVAGSTSNHARLQEIRLAAEGNHLYVLCDFHTGDAAGQNMVTIATQAVCEFIINNTPIPPTYWFVEANASGDKKASGQSFTTVRGKKVIAEVRIAAEHVQRFLHTTVERMVNYWQMSAIGGIMTGTIGAQGHYANGLAALFIACGQDAACVAEAAVGITRFEVGPEGELYASVTLPNLIVGTVGGGTALPTQQACLKLMGLAGSGHARAYAEVCAGCVLAGELSIIGALSAGEFTDAHKRLARDR